VKFTARLPGTNVNVSPPHPLKEFAVLAGGLLAVIVGVYLILGLAVDLIVPHISIRLEQKLASGFNARITDSRKLTGATASLQALVDQLQAHCAPLPYHIRVHVLPSEVVNAAALPGGNMIVFSGLLKKMTSENELAFVLAHELGHFAHRDQLRALGRTLVLMTVSTMLMGADNSINRMIGNGLVLTDLTFSRRQETRADEFALETLYCHYGNVAGATTFFRTLPKAEDPGRFGHYFASHPENRRRIAHLEALIAEHRYPLGQPQPLPRGLAIPEKQ
jgi:Zn-dependent protease with chaperone function